MNTHCCRKNVLLVLLLLVLITGCAPMPTQAAVPASAPPSSAPLLEATSAPVEQPPAQAGPTAQLATVEPAKLAPPTPDLSAPPGPLDADPQRAALIQFILDELAGPDKQHLQVAYLKTGPSSSRGKLNLAEENILRAWVFQDGSLRDSTPAFFFQSYVQEPAGSWSYAYMAFSINQASPDSITVHIDRIPGLAGGSGQIFELARQGEQWTVKSQRGTWIQ